MVKTRHSGVTESADSPEFLSLRPRRTRRRDDFKEDLRELQDSSRSTRNNTYPHGLRGSSKKESSEHSMMNGDLEPRRSSRRNRKMIYSTYNASLLGELSVSRAVSITPYTNKRSDGKGRKRIKEESEEKESDSESASESETDEEERLRRQQEDEEFKALDMYTRVKRPRPPPKKRNVYGVPVSESSSKDGDRSTDEDSSDDEDDDDDDDESDDDSSDEEEESRPTQKYFLREKKSAPQRFAIQPEVRQQRKKNLGLFHSPSRKLRKHYKGQVTPLRSPGIKRRRHATHNSSSTSSSDSSDDERRFERRKSKSMARARLRCLPMNMLPEDLAQSGILKDRAKIGTSLADVDPMTIDKSVTFESVGGLGKHIQALKEMVVFPLLYPEVFERFKITPPRGVLFHGPPGTGKTLVARALANECSQDDRRVSFFMRKGADCLSKWVGESERQLRLLFDQAYTMRPSIIFFDEIDGLAPVRSSRQDQIHSSIVSTLLALMDGLDKRGEIVVIGATNRIDSIDPALRRPGRFDREFMFPLPSAEARYSILKIHTKEWSPKLSDHFLKEVSEKCVGYVGADIKALCTEAALLALRRRYPQIYTSNEKLQLDINSIQLSARDFFQAIQNLVPTSQRSTSSPGRSLSPVIRPLLQNMLNTVTEYLQKVFPAAVVQDSSQDLQDVSEEDEGLCIFENSTRGGRTRKRSLLPQLQSDEDPQTFLNFASIAFQSPTTHRPRLLIGGEAGLGQSSHLAPAILHSLERLPVHCLDLPALFAVSARTPEESCAQVFREARRTAPSIIYMPHIGQWWSAINETLRATFLTLLQDLPPSSPVLLLATSETHHSELETQVQYLFNPIGGEVIHVAPPTDQERRDFFHDLIINQAAKAPAKRKKAAARLLEELPVAPPPEPRKLNEAELQRLEQQEEVTMRELRLFLRSILTRLASDKKFKIFTRPVDLEEVPDYLDVIKTPMDMSTMMRKIDTHHYRNVKDFLNDIKLICSNALEYNPDRDPSDKIIRHRACELSDVAHAIVDSELDPEFEKMCIDIMDSKKRRGEEPSKTAPAFYHVKPVERQGGPSQSSSTGALTSYYSSRLNKKTQGGDTQLTPDGMLNDSTDYIYYTSAQKPKKPKRRKTKWSMGFVSKKKKRKIIPKSDEGTETEVCEQEEGTENDRNGNEDTEELEEKDTAHEHEQQAVSQGKQWTRKRRRASSWSRGYVTKYKSRKAKEKKTNNDTGKDGGCQETDELNYHADGEVLNISIEEEGDDNNGQESRDNDEVLNCDRGSDNESVKSGRVARLPRIPPPSDRKLSVGESSTENSSETLPEQGERSVCQGSVEQGGCAKTTEENAEENTQGKETSKSPGENQEKVDGCQQGEASNDTIYLSNLAENASATEGKEKTANQENDKDDKVETPPIRMTRSRSANAQALRAFQILEEPIPALVVDHEKLKNLLEYTVEITKNFNIENLERLHSALSQCVYSHRRNYDKTQLIEQMFSRVEAFSRL
ncbi:ATPase family AAA domain-containing protein 2-like isoform X2 [Ptychodera flava]|uniref:ATPase family AAA domain-containing protein 2-like isoform X2 n=1 Tax=Ptychodera flava TaxID=63121 RepID=UPI003969E0DA